MQCYTDNEERYSYNKNHIILLLFKVNICLLDD